VNTWINGRRGESVDARDRGLQYGDGLFETMRVRRKGIRLLEFHLQRLYLGCSRLKIAGPDEPLLRAELERIAATRRDGVLKLILTRGHGTGKSRPAYRPSGEERCMRIVTLHPLTAAQRNSDPEAPVRIRLCRTPVNVNPALAGLKSLNRLDSVQARGEWNDARIWEGLMADAEARWVCGTMSNLFVRRGSLLSTPLVVRSGVAGVMRRWVIKNAAGAELRIRERDVRWRDIQNADEVFMTNAVVGIRSVHRIEGGEKAVKFERFDASRRLRTLLEPQ
jgi:4-amino-4-deoxychorismate lyase